MRRLGGLAAALSIWVRRRELAREYVELFRLDPNDPLREVWENIPEELVRRIALYRAAKTITERNDLRRRFNPAYL